MPTSSDEDDDYLRIHAKAIAEALQQQDALEQAGGAAPKNQTEKERLVHDTYVALCHDDPRVESDLGCQYLAVALLDPKSPYALSGPLVEGIRQLCTKQQETSKAVEAKEDSENLTNNTSTSTPKGSAMLAWAIYARIPLLCCQASNLSEIHAFLGSYRPPPPPNPLEEENAKTVINSPERHQEADRLAEMLSQPPAENEPPVDNTDEKDNNEIEEVWAAESDPSDFEFESGFSYETQMDDFQNTFAAWMIDRSDPLKLSKPRTDGTTTWKQVRHAVMDLTSQLNYRQVSSVLNSNERTITSLTGGRGAADHLTQFTMTLLVPPSTTSGPSVFDSPDDEEDALQPQRQLQAMAWYPLWVLRDAAVTQKSFSHYLGLLQTLVSVDAASSSSATKKTDPMAPATYVGLASLSALCQKFVVGADVAARSSSQNVERFRALRLALWETADDLSHVLEQEERLAKTGEGKGSDWVVWTLLPLFEILTNQRLQSSTAIVAKAESAAQRHCNQQQTSQQWSSLLQSGLFRLWMLRLQALKGNKQEKPLVWHLVRRSLLYAIAQSMSATAALGKYAWRFPSFVSLVDIGGEASKITTDADVSSFSEYSVDDILWHLLSMELAGGTAASGPKIQWKSTAKKSTAIKPLPTREECQKYSWKGFQGLCSNAVQVLKLACEEENKKENVDTNDAKEGIDETKNAATKEGGNDKAQYQVVLQSFNQFVDSLVACPQLAKLFVHDIEMTSDETQTITKCLDAIQESLSQYKAPDAPKPIHKAKGEDGEGKTEEVESMRAKKQVQDASLQEDIHNVRKALKVLRSLVSTKAGGTTSLEVTSSSKTD